MSVSVSVVVVVVVVIVVIMIVSTVTITIAITIVTVIAVCAMFVRMVVVIMLVMIVVIVVVMVVVMVVVCMLRRWIFWRCRFCCFSVCLLAVHGLPVINVTIIALHRDEQFDRLRQHLICGRNRAGSAEVRKRRRNSDHGFH